MVIVSRIHTVHDEEIEYGANNVPQLTADAEMAADRESNVLDEDEMDEEQIRRWMIVEDCRHRRRKIAAA